MKQLVGATRQVVGWLLIISGAMSVGVLIPDLYMVVVEGAKPGEPIYVDHLAAQLGGTFTYLLLSVALIVLGFFIKPKKGIKNDIRESCDQKLKQL